MDVPSSVHQRSASALGGTGISAERRFNTYSFEEGVGG